MENRILETSRETEKYMEKIHGCRAILDEAKTHALSPGSYLSAVLRGDVSSVRSSVSAYHEFRAIMKDLVANIPVKTVESVGELKKLKSQLDGFLSNIKVGFLLNHRSSLEKILDKFPVYKEAAINASFSMSRLAKENEELKKIAADTARSEVLKQHLQEIRKKSDEEDRIRAKEAAEAEKIDESAVLAAVSAGCSMTGAAVEGLFSGRRLADGLAGAVSGLLHASFSMGSAAAEMNSLMFELPNPGFIKKKVEEQRLLAEGREG